MKNLFGRDNPPLMNLFGNTPQPPIYNSPNYPNPDETMEVGAEPSAIEAFKRSVLNAPQRTRPSAMRMIGTGLLSALQGSNEPDPMEKTRTYVDGQAYQKQSYVTDPETGEKRYISGEKPRGFFESLGNKPFNIEQTSNILDMPYQAKVQDWEMRNKGLQAAANIEKSEEINRALAEQRMAQANVIPRREERLTTEGAARTQQGADRIEIARAQQSLNEWKAKNPQGKIYAPKGGNVVIIDPLTGESTDTGIPTGSLSDADRIKLTGEKRIEQIETQGEIQKGIQQTRGEQALEQIGARGEESLEQIAARGGEARKTKAVVPGGAGSTSQLPTQQKVALQLKANKAKQEHPEWSKYITTDPNTGMVEVTPPATGFFSRGPDKDTYDAIIGYMGGAPTGTIPAAKKAEPPPKKDEKVEPGRVKVADASGKVVATIPAADVPKLNKKKYHVVK